MKAARAVDLGESLVEPHGLAGDRRWMLADEDGRFISQREEPALARVSVIFGTNDDAVTISSHGSPRCEVAVPRDAALVKVSVWGTSFVAMEAGPAADRWFSAYLDRPVRLVYLDDPARRPLDPDYGRPGETVSFADGFPLLLTSAGSLGQLGDWLADEGEQPVPMTRFRPNVVVAGAPPWAEDRQELVFGQNLIPDAGGVIRVGDPVDILEAA